MRTTWVSMTWLGAVLLGLAGCKSPGPKIKPPPLVEQYTIPPADDPRFSAPISYPKGTLFKDAIKKDDFQQGPPSLRGPSRLGGGGGPGGPY